LRGANTIDTLYERGLGAAAEIGSKERLVRRYHEQFHWPAGGGDFAVAGRNVSAGA